MRTVFRASLKRPAFNTEWFGPITKLFGWTEGYNWMGWNCGDGFFAKHQGLEWLLAAIAAVRA